MKKPLWHHWLTIQHYTCSEIIELWQIAQRHWWFSVFVSGLSRPEFRHLPIFLIVEGVY